MRECNLCGLNIPEGCNYLTIRLLFCKDSETKLYTLCPVCIDNILKKASSGWLGRVIRGQLPVDLLPFLERNVKK